MARSATHGARYSAAEDERIRTLRAAGNKVRDIAQALGRSEESVSSRMRWIDGVGGQSSKRKCLCCGRTFPSEGPHNRLCGSCRRQSVSPYAP